MWIFATMLHCWDMNNIYICFWSSMYYCTYSTLLECVHIQTLPLLNKTCMQMISPENIYCVFVLSHFLKIVYITQIILWVKPVLWSEEQNTYNCLDVYVSASGTSFSSIFSHQCKRIWHKRDIYCVNAFKLLNFLQNK